MHTSKGFRKLKDINDSLQKQLDSEQHSVSCFLIFSIARSSSQRIGENCPGEQPASLGGHSHQGAGRQKGVRVQTNDKAISVSGARPPVCCPAKGLGGEQDARCGAKD